MPEVEGQITRGGARARQAAPVAGITACLRRVPSRKREHPHIVIREIAEEDRGFADRLTDDRRRHQPGGGASG